MTDVVQPDAKGIARAAEVLRSGGLVAFPTETVYGLGAHALNPAAVRRVFEVKGRPTADPLIVHIDSLGSLAPLVEAIPDVARRLASRFWPGPLTLVLRRSTRVPDEVTAGLDTVAVRVPAHPVAAALLAAAAIPVAAPSANLFSRPSPTRAAHVLQDLNGRIDVLIDGGQTPVGVESTVLDLSGDTALILRPGAVTLEMVREVIPDARLRGSGAAADGLLRSPGLLERHYSPRAPLTLYEGHPSRVIDRIRQDADEARARGQRVGIVAAIGDAIDGFEIARLGTDDDLAAVAAGLYAALRDLDAWGADIILARGFPADFGLGVAIRDRLRRAAAGRVVVVPN